MAARASATGSIRGRGPQLDRVAKALMEAEGMEFKCDENKLKTLKEQRAAEKARQAKISKDIKLENRKRKRLMDKCRALPTNDLLECFRIRFEAETKREAAKQRNPERTTEESPEREVPEPESRTAE